MKVVRLVALAMALERRGRWFDPALVDALPAIRDDRRFWGPFEDPRTVPVVAAWEPADRVRTAGEATSTASPTPSPA
jgi:hypothetical protein